MEKRQLDDQLDHPALRLIAARPDLFTRQGNVAASYRRRGAKMFGPYYRLSYRQNGRQCSVYLSVAGPLVKRVRQALSALQLPLDQRRTLNRLRQSILVSLRVQKLRVNTLLHPFGLRLKGFEVRGWRFSPLRSLLPRRRRLIPRIFLRRPARHPFSNNNPSSRLLRFLESRDGYTPADADSMPAAPWNTAECDDKMKRL